VGNIRTDFTGYDQLEDSSTIIATVKDNSRTELHEGDEGAIIVEHTPSTLKVEDRKQTTALSPLKQARSA